MNRQDGLSAHTFVRGAHGCLQAQRISATVDSVVPASPSHAPVPGPAASVSARRARSLRRGTEVRIHLTSESGPMPATGIVVRGTHAPGEVTVMVSAGPAWAIGAYYDRRICDVDILGGAS
jgi:hypothetical protein